MNVLDLFPNPLIELGVFFVLVFIMVMLLVKASEHKDKAHEFEKKSIIQEGLINERNLEIQKVQSDLKGNAQDLAVKYFDEWKQTELTKYIKLIEQTGIEKAQALLNQWKIYNEDRIRKDAANRSVRNVLGKVTEHLVPFSDAMKQFNPKDIRFIGSPIDLIVFDGAEELKKDEVTIYFVEVKTGTSALSKRQILIRDAIEKQRVKWLPVTMKNFGDSVNEALSQ